MQTYSGIIEIVSVTTVPLAQNNGDAGMIAMENKHVRFVHYPDCQQLITWLPQAGSEYGLVRLINKKNESVVEECTTRSRLNGSIQVLWDTLPFAPGLYAIEFNCNKGYQHIILFEKFDEGYKPLKKEEPVASSTTAPPIVYKDATGKPLEEEDKKLQQALQKTINKKFGPYIEYEGNFRAGTIIYYDGDTCIRFYHEMGGGNCMFYIMIPTGQQWEQATKTALAERNNILQFVATTVQQQQASSTRFVIDNDQVTFYYK